MKKRKIKKLTTAFMNVVDKHLCREFTTDPSYRAILEGTCKNILRKEHTIPICVDISCLDCPFQRDKYDDLSKVKEKNLRLVNTTSQCLFDHFAEFYNMDPRFDNITVKNTTRTFLTKYLDLSNILDLI